MIKKNYLTNILIFIFLLLIDQLTKKLAINFFSQNNFHWNFISFELIKNRGVSWGICHSDNKFIFVGISLIILFIISILIWHIFSRIKLGYNIFGEILILSGAISNFIDRIIHGGVIDFIIISVNHWSWPAFNIADISIIIGAIVMLFCNIYNSSCSVPNKI